MTPFTRSLREYGPHLRAHQRHGLLPHLNAGIETFPLQRCANTAVFLGCEGLNQTRTVCLLTEKPPPLTFYFQSTCNSISPAFLPAAGWAWSVLGRGCLFPFSCGCGGKVLGLKELRTGIENRPPPLKKKKTKNMWLWVRYASWKVEPFCLGKPLNYPALMSSLCFCRGLAANSGQIGKQTWRRTNLGCVIPCRTTYCTTRMLLVSCVGVHAVGVT